jgi:quinol monooxygenase YgiN
MEDTLYTLYHLSIDPDDFEQFRDLAEVLVKATSNEPETTIYEYVVNSARTEVHIVERYRTAGLLPHVEQTFAPYAARFLELAKIERVFVYGDPTPEIRAKLDEFGAIYFAPMVGFAL